MSSSSYRTSSTTPSRVTPDLFVSSSRARSNAVVVLPGPHCTLEQGTPRQRVMTIRDVVGGARIVVYGDPTTGSPVGFPCDCGQSPCLFRARCTCGHAATCAFPADMH